MGRKDIHPGSLGLVSGKSEMHNNLLYSLLRRFVESGWVSKRKGAGQRGQTREIYALTNKASKNCSGASAILQARKPLLSRAFICVWGCSACWMPGHAAQFSPQGTNGWRRGSSGSRGFLARST